MDISKLKHYADFNLETQALGTIRCGPFTTDDLNEADIAARTTLPNGEALATQLLLSIARKLTGSEEVDSVCGGPALTDEEVAQITRGELDKFSEEFIERRLRKATGQPTEQAGSSVKTGCERLPDEIIAQTDSQRAQMKRILGHARSSFLGESSLEAVRKALAETSIEEQMRKFGIGDAFKHQMHAAGVGDTLKDHMRAAGVGDAFKDQMRAAGVGDTLKDQMGAAGVGDTLKDRMRAASVGDAFKDQMGAAGVGDTLKDRMRAASVGDAFKDQMRAAGVGDALKDHMLKLGIGESATARMRKDLLGASALDAAIRTFKASDNLSESIAALRATDAAAAQPEQTHANLPPFQPPRNPILETNKLLKKQQSYAEEIRPTIIRCAELIQTLTDTTLATQILANENAAQAEKHAARSMWVAIASILIAVITSATAIYYASSSPSADQIDKLAKAISNQIAASDASATAERAAATVRAKEDREALVAAISLRSAGPDPVAEKPDEPGVKHGSRTVR
jgi:uncharacterized protein YidB (DUF937 family)